MHDAVINNQDLKEFQMSQGFKVIMKKTVLLLL